MSFPPVQSEPLPFGATSHSSTGLMVFATSKHVKQIEFRIPNLKASPSISCQIVGEERKSSPLTVYSLKINENVGGKTQVAISAQTLDAKEAKGEHYCNIVVIEPKPSVVPADVSIPKGTILPWYSKDKKPPRGWHGCDAIDGRPNFNGLWMVGTDDPEAVGKVVNLNSIELSLSGTASATGTDLKYGATSAGPAPHAPGMTHTHPVSVSGTFSDRSKFAPPSMQVRYIIKID